jgi:RNA polymerase sigma-70 factor (ECF subfamily)
MNESPSSAAVPTPPTPAGAGDPAGIDLTAVATGDAAATEALYRELFEPVYAFVFWRVGGVRSDAEDVTQETFVTALSTVDRFQGRSSLHTWICGIARNLAHARVRARARDAGSPDATERTEIAVGPEGSPERLLEKAQTDQLVGRALTELPPHYQRALLEKYVNQRSFSEMAAEGRSTPKAVEGVVQRAKGALAAALARLGIAGEDGGPHG